MATPTPDSGLERRLANLRRGGGRKPGVPNKVTVEAKAFCTSLVNDKRYKANLRKRLRKGEAPPAVECMVWYYAAGKPKERVEFGADKSLAQLVLEAIQGKPDE